MSFWFSVNPWSSLQRPGREQPAAKLQRLRRLPQPPEPEAPVPHLPARIGTNAIFCTNRCIIKISEHIILSYSLWTEFLLSHHTSGKDREWPRQWRSLESSTAQNWVSSCFIVCRRPSWYRNALRATVSASMYRPWIEANAKQERGFLYKKSESSGLEWGKEVKICSNWAAKLLMEVM